MKKSLLLLSAILTVTLLVGCTNNNNEENQGGSVNNSNNNNNNIVENQKEPELPTTHIKGEKTLDTLTFNDIRIVEEGTNQNKLIATVKNNSSENISSRILDIELFTGDNQSIGIVGAILPDVAAGGTATMEVPIALGVMETNNIQIRYSGN